MRTRHVNAKSFNGLTAWLRPNAYVVGTWSRAAGATDWTQGTAANQPAASSGFPVFDGSNDYLQPNGGTGRVQDLFGASAKTMFFVVSVPSATLNNAALYTNNSPLCDTAGYFGIFFKSGATVTAYNWDGNPQTIEKPYTFGTKILCTVTHDGVNMRFAVNGAAFTSVASGPTQSLVGSMMLGRSYQLNYSTGTVYEWATYNVVLADRDINRLRQSMMLYHRIS